MKFSLKRKTILLVLLIALVLSSAAVFVSYRVYSRTIDDRYKTTAMDLAKTAAALSDAQKVAGYAEQVLDIYRQNPAPEFADAKEETAYYAEYDGIADSYYQELYNILTTLKSNNGEVQYLYLFALDSASHTGVYLIDADASESACPMGTWDIIYEENYGIFEDPTLGFPAYISHSDFGWLCSAGAPIEKEDGTVVGYAMVDVSMDQVMADRADFLRLITLVIILITVILTLIFINIINQRVVQPLNHLALAANSFVTDKTKGSSSGIAQLNIHTGDEIENLALSVQQMELDINQYIVNLTAVTAEKERISAELGVAQQIQADMLPSIFPAFPDHQEFDIYATMDPAKEVGGDFYDFFLVDDDHLCMVMADVSGKGVPAALFMVIAKTLLKNCALNGPSPKNILETVNNQLCEGNQAEMFVTVWLGILQLSTGKMLAANAGHEFPVIKRGNNQFELLKDRHGFVLAGMEHSRYREYELELHPGDKLFLYTDGVPEATNGQEELYGTDRMLLALNRMQEASPKQLLEGLKQDIDAFVGEAQQFDDITMLGFSLSGLNIPHQLTLEPTAESTAEAAAFAEKTFAELGVPDSILNKLNIVLDEVYSNIVNYSGASSATITCMTSGGDAILRFEDNGMAYDPLAALEPDITLPAEKRKIGGLGIFMVKKMMDELYYERKEEKNIFTICKHLS